MATETKQIRLYQKTEDGVDILHPETEASVVLGLADVATSGDYSDLSGTPTIPSATTVVNNLDSTSTTSALSAYQGNVLNGKIPTLTYDATTKTLTITTGGN